MSNMIKYMNKYLKRNGFRKNDEIKTSVDNTQKLSLKDLLDRTNARKRNPEGEDDGANTVDVYIEEIDDEEEKKKKVDKPKDSTDEDSTSEDSTSEGTSEDTSEGTSDSESDETLMSFRESGTHAEMESIHDIPFEIMDYILAGSPFTSQPRKKQFIDDSEEDDKNRGRIPVNDPSCDIDVLRFVQQFNPDVEFIQATDNTYITSGNSIVETNNGEHVIYVYENEVYDVKDWQRSTNNDTLFIAIIGAVRIHVKKYTEERGITIGSIESSSENTYTSEFDFIMKLLEQIRDTKGSDTCDKLIIISKHYFGRGEEWFRYADDDSATTDDTDKSTRINESVKQTLLIYIHGMKPYGRRFGMEVSHELACACMNRGMKFEYYVRRTNNPIDEWKYFIDWLLVFVELTSENEINMKSSPLEKYTPIEPFKQVVLVGHSYGAVFAKYFASKLGERICPLVLSLDGSDLKEYCSYIAYDIYKLKGEIVYGEYDAKCKKKSLVKLIDEYDNSESSKHGIEIHAKGFYKYMKLGFDSEPKCKLIFRLSYDAAKESQSANEVVVNHIPDEEKRFHNHGDIDSGCVKCFTIHYANQYYHSLHMFKPVAKIIYDMIEYVVINGEANPENE